jgi:hypothetical protein
MPVNLDELSGAVHFEIADLASAARLTRRLGQVWHVSLHDGPSVNVVFAILRSEPGDLALLLRSVEAWVGEESLCAIRYNVDGRDYVLRAGGADWAGAGALFDPDPVQA